MMTDVRANHGRRALMPARAAEVRAVVTLPPRSMKEFDIRNTGAKIDVAAIEWPANATAIVVDHGALVCRITDPDESKDGAETSEIRIECDRDQVIGTSSALARNK